MASTAIPGRHAKLEVSDDGGTTYSNVGGIVDINMPINIDELECTSHDSAGVREYLANFSDFTMDMSLRFLDGNPGQDILLESSVTKVSFMFIFYMKKDPASGNIKFEGSGFPTSMDLSGPLDDTAGMDTSLRLSSVVKGVQ